jgi:hypothetical protein
LDCWTLAHDWFVKVRNLYVCLDLRFLASPCAELNAKEVVGVYLYAVVGGRTEVLINQKAYNSSREA